jgi:hypothetical protein
LRRALNFEKAFFHRVRGAHELGTNSLASFGLVGVLVILSIFAMWGALSTYRTATAAKRFSELSYAFEQARFAVAAEESLNRKYRLQPSAEVLDQHREAATSLSAALQQARVVGAPADGVLIGDAQGISAFN